MLRANTTTRQQERESGLIGRMNLNQSLTAESETLGVCLRGGGHDGGNSRRNETCVVDIGRIETVSERECEFTEDWARQDTYI